MENSVGCLAPELQSAADIIERQICKGWRHCGAGLSHPRGFGYGVVVEVASMITVRVLVAVLPQVS
jgi:hypothetical protein